MSTESTNSYSQVAGYNESFKMTVVGEVISGQISQNAAQKKYGIGGHCTITKWIKKYGTNKEIKKIIKVRMPHDKLKIKELKTRVHQLEHLVSDLQLEKKALDKLIELAEREYKISIKKNSGLQQLTNSKERTGE
jgi:transposase-like protein